MAEAINEDPTGIIWHISSDHTLCLGRGVHTGVIAREGDVDEQDESDNILRDLLISLLISEVGVHFHVSIALVEEKCMRCQTTYLA